MSLSYLFHARKALFQAINELEDLDNLQKQQIYREVSLKPPKNTGWGDLCTNIIILLKSKEYIIDFNAEDRFIKAFSELPGLDTAVLAESGYINLKYGNAIWQNGVTEILEKDEKYGLDPDNQEISIEFPNIVNDLTSARLHVNAKSLRSVAGLTGWSFDERAEVEREPFGFPLETAIARCGKSQTDFALIANPPAFIDAFSPILAIDKTYDNPVFCIPYARRFLMKLLDRAKAIEETAADMSVLSLPIEVKLAKLLCGWPMAVEKTWRKRDVFYLIAFLQDVSLLFFRLVEERRPISSEYLRTEPAVLARLLLLSATKKILDQGLDILDLQSTEEFV
ncbi:DALR anticodon-binding domain-containing protein [Sneathiella marina]|uniref:arginine--tRNA ligase n=1 Tax=Sneathiella marina TaxID=2950108 RepID=A0ABY4W5H0_9PROT|nr:DALR anticodon-binding domain-containing protein [Sneathiella marina]USG59891.1 DALR anticodon-binding domain-containing protein [Sneathiella marina]